LLRRRDAHIAKRIFETLAEGETGILFIGAYHDVLSKLPADIEVIQVKDITKVRAYHRALIDLRHRKNLAELAVYLTAPIPSPS
jgi:hypothetical protein